MSFPLPHWNTSKTSRMLFFPVTHSSLLFSTQYSSAAVSYHTVYRAMVGWLVTSGTNWLQWTPWDATSSSAAASLALQDRMWVWLNSVYRLDTLLGKQGHRLVREAGKKLPVIVIGTEHYSTGGKTPLIKVPFHVWTCQYQDQSLKAAVCVQQKNNVLPWRAVVDRQPPLDFTFPSLYIICIPPQCWRKAGVCVRGFNVAAHGMWHAESRVLV